MTSTPNPTMLEALRQQAGAIYQNWLNGNISSAGAMVSQVPLKRQPYVVMAMTILAIHDGQQYRFSQFIEGLTQ